MVRTGIVFLAAAALAAAVAGCCTEESMQRRAADRAAAAERHIEVIARDMRFEPSRIEVQPGQLIEVILINRGDAPHNIEFHLDGREAELPDPIQPGWRASLVFPTPSEPGEYRFYCPVGDHEQRGMTGTLVVGR